MPTVIPNGIKGGEGMYNIKAERVRCGMTVEDAANALGVHKNAVYRWERGLAEPSASHLVAMASIYGCTPDYLLGWTDDRNGRAVASV